MESVGQVKQSEVFLDEDEMKQYKNTGLDGNDIDMDKDEEPEETKNEALELNDITNKQNEVLWVGTYGNGTAYLKAAFFVEMKTQKNCFKVKFISKSKDLNKKNTIFGELYQVESNGKNILILLTKNISSENKEYLLTYLSEHNITYNGVIVFTSKSANNFMSTEQQKNGCYYVHSRMCSLNKGAAVSLPAPNSISGWAAYLWTSLDFKDGNCLIWISVHGEYDIGLDSVRFYNNGVSGLDYWKGKVDSEYLTKNGVEVGQIKSVFNEYNAIKKSYFS